jgi:hypothetical protein
MTCARALHTVHRCVGRSKGGAREKMFWTLEALPLVVSACIDLGGGDDNDDDDGWDKRL